MSDEFQASVRRTQRVIRMVSDLHRLGYQRLRVMPYIYPLAWRVAIGPADLFSERNGAWMEHTTDDVCAAYSSASSNRYFGWTDARSDNARQLADKFIKRFPGVCAAGYGRDWAYAGWLCELLGALERENALPFVMEEYAAVPPEQLDHLPLRRMGDMRDLEFPLPPAPNLSGAVLITPALIE
ncbi:MULTISPECIES: hypothetical protein [unclassified Brevundimonas]|uniref:hypothetical protein n=1 Tax=unclassified Brevundimonas TaxID=2622653 RepID=UPI000AF92D1A|nr:MULTISPECIES: hypothetical protein [unclassified Brevundimonas]